MKAGSQAWISYGKRTNAFLLVNYGFCFKDNLYDSVKCYLSLDLDCADGNRFAEVAEMVLEDGMASKVAVQEIRFKRYGFNQTLMAYIRLAFRRPWSSEMALDPGQNLPISRISNLLFEVKCLERYEEIVLHMINKLEAKKPLEGDFQLLYHHEKGTVSLS